MSTDNSCFISACIINTYSSKHHDAQTHNVKNKNNKTHSTHLIHPQSLLHLILQRRRFPKLISLKDILPPNLRIPTPKHQDILMHITPLRPTQHSRPERTITHNLQLHAAAHRLGDAIRPTQTLHLHRILRLAPREQTGFERVCGVWDFGCGRRRRAPGGLGGDFVAEGVGEAGG